MDAFLHCCDLWSDVVRLLPGPSTVRLELGSQAYVLQDSPGRPIMGLVHDALTRQGMELPTLRVSIACRLLPDGIKAARWSTVHQGPFHSAFCALVLTFI